MVCSRLDNSLEIFILLSPEYFLYERSYLFTILVQFEPKRSIKNPGGIVPLKALIKRTR